MRDRVKVRSRGQIGADEAGEFGTTVGAGGGLLICRIKWLRMNRLFPSYQNLFMLVPALMGLDRMKAAYAYAIGNGYRFYSYEDASLLLP